LTNHQAGYWEKDLGLHRLIEEQVERTPNRAALVFERQRLTYRELNRRANQLAHHLKDLGAGPDVLVGLFAERSLDVLVGILGILKAGAAYLPIDADFPQERISFMLADGNVSLLLTQSSLLSKLPSSSARSICLDSFNWADSEVPNRADADFHPESLAYVIYTSGSTGRPKGVCIEHRNIVNYVLGVAERLRLEAGMNHATVSSIAADLGNTVVFPALCTGGCLHIISQERATSHAMLSEYFKRESIDVLKIVPSHLAALQTANPEQVMPRRRLILGGEASRVEWIQRLRGLSPNCEIYNHYGPTETTVGVLTYPVAAKLPSMQSGTLPLGKPLPNSTIYVLDEHGNQAPTGVEGELCIGGAGVARGYLNRPDLTAEKFVLDPFSPKPGARMYHTGDLARALPDGNLEFCGRIDHQVKIRGYRVELGEMERLSEAKRRLLEQRMHGTALQTEIEHIRPRPAGSTVPLSAEQRRVWLHASQQPELPIYNEPFTIHRHGSFDLGILEASMNEVLRRHEAWRTSCSPEGEEVIHHTVRVTLPFVDLSGLPGAEREAEALRIATEDAQKPIPLDAVPLFRAQVVRMKADEHRLYLTVHHITFDAISISHIFLPELSAIYASFERGKPSPLPAPALQYGDYALWQEGRVDSPAVRQHLAYWLEQFSGELPVLRLPEDRPRPAIASHRGSMECFEMPAELVENLRRLSHRQGVTLYMTLLAAFKVLLFRYTGQNDLIVGSATDARRRPELETVMGYFVDTFAIRTRPVAELRFSEYLAHTRDAVLGALAAADVPFDRVVHEVNPQRDTSHHPIFQAFFSIRPLMPSFSEGWNLTQMDVTVGTSKFVLHLELCERPDHMEARFLYSTDIWDPSTIRRMASHWLVLLQSICQNPESTIGALSILTAEETTALLGLGGWNDTTRPFPQATLNVLIEDQLRRTPHAIAAGFGNERWTYEELNSRADALASLLRAVGVTRGSIVAIVLDRSLDLLAGLIAVLKTGAAYLPLDIQMPRERIRLCLADAKPSAILTQRSLVQQVASSASAIVLVDGNRENQDLVAVDALANEPMQIKNDLEDTAYLIYTSGTTGVPKAVEIQQRSLVNLLAAMQTSPGFGPGDVLLAVTPISFDIAALELFLPIISGGMVVIASREEAQDPYLLEKAIRRSGCTVMQATPATWRTLLLSGWDNARQSSTGNSSRMLRVLCGGEALPRELADRLLAAGAELWNMYGPTETTIWSLIHRVHQGTEKEAGRVPVGRPIANTKAYILDERCQPLPIGVPGELFLGGVGLAKGYRGQPQQTADRFMTVESVGEFRLYRTGDVAVRRADGIIEVLGRTDHQVKIRGHRVELGEIETVLRQNPGVRDALVVASEDNTGSKQLVAYVVPMRADQPLWEKKAVHILRDGTPVAHLNRNETDYIYNEIFVLQAYLRHGITIREGDCIVDASSNIGLFTVFASRLARNLRIVSFEPNPAAYACLKANAEAWGARVKCLPVGLSSENKSATLTFFEGKSDVYADAAVEREVVKDYVLNQEPASRDNAPLAAEIDALIEDRLHAKAETIQLRTLSSVIAEEHLDRIDLLKINVEKSELDVLLGLAPEDWPKIRQLVIEVDLQQNLEPITSLLEQRGYDVLVEQDPLLRHTDLRYVYAIRPAEGGSQLIRQQTDDGHVRPVPPPNQEILTAVMLRRFLKDRLPQYMIPLAFVPLKKFPLTSNGKIDRKALPPISYENLQPVYDFVKHGTETETKLASIWARLLKVNNVGIDDDFFELGGHSLLAVVLANEVEQAFGKRLPLASFIQAPTIRQLARLVDSVQQEQGTAAANAAFLPRVQTAAEARFEPFALNDIQQAYIVGRSDAVELGNIPCQFYREVDVDNWNAQQFEIALRKTVQRHEMLRCTILPDGMQQILPEAPVYKVQVEDLRGLDPVAAAARLETTRGQMIHHSHTPEQWPLFEFRASHLDSRNTRIHIRIDLLIADGRSHEIFFGDLMRFYRDPQAVLPALDLSFRDYLSALESASGTELFKKSKQYWEERVPSLPPSPDLPLAKNPAVIARPVFKRRSARMDAEAWRNLKANGGRFRVTPSGILLAAYAEVLATWSKNQRFTVNLALFNRLPLHPQANEIIGEFTAVNLLAVDNSTPDSFAKRARRHQEQLWQDLDHRSFSGIEVMRESARLHGVGPRAVMPVVFTSLLNLDESAGGTTWCYQMGRSVFGQTQTPQVYLDFIIEEDKGTLVLNWDAVDELFEPGMLDEMFESLQHLLFELATDNAGWNRSLSDNARRLLPAAQIEVRQRVNATEGPLSDELLHTPFLKQVAERPNHVAIITSTRRLTYDETYRRACRIEEELLDRDVKPNQMIGVLMEKGWEQVVAILGIHFAGGAYLPIDSELPVERQRYLIEHGGTKIVLTQSKLLPRLDVPAGVVVLAVDRMDPLAADVQAPRRRQKPEDLAYVIYTSGSTGLPKGVMIDHRGAMNTVLDINQRFGVGPQDRVLALSRLNFDLSVYDIFGLLSVGGAVVMPAAELAQDVSHWMELIASESVTVWNSVPALMQLLVEDTESANRMGRSLRLVMMSGDWIPLNLPDQIRKLLPSARIVSLGGATEASIWSIMYPIENVDPNWKSIPYGKPMLNQTFQVLNQSMAPCPVWVPGQLYIGGVGVAKGYWRDEQKTNASFVRHPETGQMLYRTGDLGRYLPDGNIEFLGREDFQVKIQGYRIELGEIEIRLQEHPAVESCVVTVDQDSPGEKRLAGYVIAKPGEKPEASELRDYLRSKLAEYMVPPVFVFLDRFPLTANGKVDRKALPAPARAKTGSDSAALSSRDFLEIQLTQLWEKILGVQPVGPQDSFFDLGGTSMMAVRLFSELRKRFGKRFSLSTLFQAPTVEKIAELLRGNGYAPSWSSLVPIQPHGARPPFFCVHGAGGNLLMFEDLANRMAPDHPFYGLQAQGLDGSKKYLKSVEEMAVCYLREIRQFQPVGPYYLGGFCLGGQVAFEMAQQLRKQGETVALLAIIDTYNFHGVHVRFSFVESLSTVRQKFTFHFLNVARLGLKEQLRYLGKKIKGAYIRESGRLITRISNLRRVNYQGLEVENAELEHINEEAHFSYIAAPYDGKTVMFKAAKNYSHLHDPMLGWDGVITGPLEFIELPSNPGGLFMEPYVQVLAEKLKERIDDTLRPTDVAPPTDVAQTLDLAKMT